jgi:general secretion pathway protein J
MTTSGCSDRCAGFTLLEAVVATALMAVILAALATITRQWLPNWNRGIERVQGTDQVALGLERLAADIAAAEFVSMHGRTRLPVFDGTDQSITFVRTPFGPNAGSGLDLISITEIDTDRGPAMVRTRAPFLPHVTIIPKSDPVVLVRMPYRLSFAYAGAGQNWQPRWRAQRQLPTAVRLTLQGLNRPETAALTRTVAVRAHLPIECLSAQSVAACLATPWPEDQPAVSGP